jgi:hypothetical protein
MRAALAARQPKDAQAAMDWLRSSGYQGASMSQLAAQLATAGATK